MIRHLSPDLPDFSRYIEPFVGSGQMFFALPATKSIIADSNPELIHSYRAIKSDASNVAGILESLTWDEDHYYKVRNLLFNRSRGVRRAAYFIYLNRLCWNGLFRVNAKGKFNVPFGHQKYTKAFVEGFLVDLIRSQDHLKKTRIIHGDFARTCSLATAGDLVFLDPPYVTGQGPRAFREYTSSSFSELDEVRLAKEAINLANRGVHVVVTHASTDLSRKLYGGYFHATEIGRSETIAGSASSRKHVRELVFSTFELVKLQARLRALKKSLARTLVS